MRKFFKVLRNILIVIVILVICIFAASKISEDRIIAKAIEVINTKVAVPISVSKVQLNLFRNFPHLTVELKDVIIESSPQLSKVHFKDLPECQFLELNSIYLSFNLKSILDNSFELSTIVLSKGVINILVDKNGVNNYEIFTKSDAKKSERNFEIELNSVQLKQVKVNYVNAYKKLGVYLQTNNFMAKAKFYDKSYAISTKGLVKLNKYSSHEFSFIPKNPTHIKADLSIDNESINIKSGTFITEGIQFNSIGKITITDPLKIDISLSGNEISIASLLEVIPVKTEVLDQLDATGLLEVNTRIIGQVSGKLSPRIKTVFTISNGTLHKKNTDVQIKNLMLDGSFNNYSLPQFSVSDFSFNSDSSHFEGSMNLRSIKDPVIELETDFNIYANEIYELFLKNQVDTLSGNIRGKLSTKGLIQSEFSLDVLSVFNNRGHVEFNNFYLLIDEQKLKLESASGTLSLLNEKLAFMNVEGLFQNSQVKCSGEIVNFPGMFSSSPFPVDIIGNLWVNNLSYSNIEHWFVSDSNTKITETIYHVDANLHIKEFNYDKFIAENISGRLLYKNGQIKANQFVFNAFNGRVESSITYGPAENSTHIFQTMTNTYDIDINQFFSVFKNFNQTFITDKNISGNVSSSFEGEIVSLNGKFNANSIDLLGHIKITDGRLIDFEPAQKLSSFSDIDDLRELSFNTIENDILISNGKITIPKMEIVTNVMDISVFGDQELNGDYEYHIKLLLSDLLRKKSKSVREKQSEFGAIEDDGLGNSSIYLLASGANGETTVKFDRKELRSNLRTDVQEERREMKKVLNKEFGWFKKDSIDKEKDKEKPQFQIEWDEE